MTSRATAWFETKYVDGAIHALQTEGYLTKGLFAPATDKNGLTVTWKIAGKGSATLMSQSVEDRPTLNAARDRVSATMAEYEANEWILTTDLTKMSENEQMVAQQTCAYAIGRKFDTIPFAAMDAAAGAITTIGNGTAQISPLNLLSGAAAIKANGIAGSPIVNVAMTYKHMAQLLCYKAISSSDFVTDNPFMKELGARSWMGMRLIPMPDEYFAATTGQASSKDVYMWLQPAVGFTTPTDANGRIAMATRIDYVATKKAYFAANTMSAASAVLLADGVRRLSFLNTDPSSLSNL
jgi:hypothetical protein